MSAPARARRVALAMLIAVAGAAPGSLSPAHAQEPAPGTSRTRLANGITVLVRENPYAPVVAMSLVVRMGTRWERPESAGISNFLQLMVVRGTEKRDGQEIVEAADRMGGSIDAYGDAEYSEIAATALARFWVPMLEMVVEIARQPTIPEGTTGAVRDFLARQVRNRGDKPYDVAVDTLNAHLFAGTGYAWNPLGRRDSLEKLNRAALLEHYHAFYDPRRIVIAVSGDVRRAEVLAQAERLLGTMATGPTAIPEPTTTVPSPAAAREEIQVPGAQAQIVMGTLAPAMTDPDYAPLKVLSTVLGGGMAGRFFSELRDKQGLAYTTAAQYPSHAGPSVFMAQIGTAPENVDKAEAALRAELERVQRERVGDEELRVAKAYLLGSLAMDRRTNARQAWYLGVYESAQVRAEFLDGYVSAVQRVTAADVQRVARRYLSQLRTVVVRPPAR